MRWQAFYSDASTGKIQEAVKQHPEQQMFPVVTADRRYLGYVKVEDIKAYEAVALSAKDILAKAIAAGEPRNTYVDHTDSEDEVKYRIDTEKLQFVPVVGPGHIYMGTADVNSFRGHSRVGR